jgi:hypothetical protein
MRFSRRRRNFRSDTARNENELLHPTDDAFDVAVAAILVHLLGWHWEFLPAFAAELIPGVDLVPSWTFAVLNVYRKWKAAFNAESNVRDALPEQSR